MAANAALCHVGAALRLPTEIWNKIVSDLPSIRDVVALYLALCKHDPTGERVICWNQQVKTHQSMLVSNANLCKQISWNEDHRLDWEKTAMRPHPSTRLPQTRTYGEMIRYPAYRPSFDLDGKAVDLDRVRDSLFKEQMAMRLEYITMSRTRRNNNDRPSERSRERLGLPISNADKYKQLLDKEQNPKRRKAIESCRIDDEAERSTRLGRPKAMCDFFVNVVTDPDFDPAVCIGCLDDDIMDEGVMSEFITTKLRLRFCLQCFLEYLECKGLEFISLDDLTLSGIPLPPFQRFREPWMKIVSAGWVTREHADELCRVRHGVSWEQFQEGILMPAVELTNDTIYNVASFIACRIIMLHQQTYWSRLPVNDMNTSVAWSEMIHFARRAMAEQGIDADHVQGDYQTLHELAALFWNDRLLTTHRRISRDLAYDLFCVVEPSHLFSAGPEGPDPLQGESLTVTEVANLCMRIHGMRVKDVVKDKKACRKQLHQHLANVAGLNHLFRTLHHSIIDVIMNLLSIASNNGNPPSTGPRLEVLRAFQEAYLELMKGFADPIARSDYMSLKSIYAVPADLALYAANVFLKRFRNGPLKKVLEWASDKYVAILLPHDGMQGRSEWPPFLNFLLRHQHISVVGRQPRRFLHGHHGRIYWRFRGTIDGQTALATS